MACRRCGCAYNGGITIFSLGVFLIGFSTGTTYWTVDQQKATVEGLILTCTDWDNCTFSGDDNKDVFTLMLCAVALATVASIASVASMAFILSDTLLYLTKLIWLVMTAAGMCGITGDIVYLVRSISAVSGLLPNQELGYSFYLSLLGSLCLLVSGTVVKLGAIQRFRDQARENGLVCHVTQPPPYSSITIAHNYIQEQLLQITLSPPPYESLTNQDQGADHSQQVHTQEPPPPYTTVSAPQPSPPPAVISQSPPPAYV